MIILVGESGSGKTEVAKKIIKKYGFRKLVTYTTRKKRMWEQDGVDYHFIGEKEFLLKKEAGFFLETVNYGTNYYGTARQDILPDRVLIVEAKGANTYKSKLKDKAMVVFLSASKDVRYQRMLKRGDALPDIKARIEKDEESFHKSNLCQIDLTIDTEHMNEDEIADVIFKEYKSFIVK